MFMKSCESFRSRECQPRQHTWQQRLVWCDRFLFLRTFSCLLRICLMAHWLEYRQASMYITWFDCHVRSLYSDLSTICNCIIFLNIVVVVLIRDFQKLHIDFDVYYTSSSFRKSDPGPPNYHISVARCDISHFLLASIK